MASRAAILRAARAGSPGAAQRTPPPQGDGTWIGQLPSYSMEPGSPYTRGYGPFLPRPPGTFTSGAFSPLSPILPVPVDQPPPGYPRAQPRRWQPYVGYNLPVGQPGNEGYKLASFATLKTLAETYSILRTCLERRKNEVRALAWDITLTPEAAKAYQGDREAMRSFGERRAEAKKWFKRPDLNYFTMESWLHAMMDQVFTIDALSLYMCPKMGKRAGMGRGLLGSDLDKAWLIDGSSIRPLMGLHGEVPAPPAPGFQQYEFGVPRADLTTMAAGMDLADGEQGALLAQVAGDQLVYHPYLQRVDSPYGFSLVEQALIPIMTGLRKQAYQLDYFNESTTPRVYISPGDNTLTPNQIREMQDAMNAVAGDIGWSFKVQVLAPNSKVIPVKEMEIVDQADEWIATEVAMVCDISPMELGILPKISTVASPFAAREMAQANRAIRERTATKPTLSYVSSVFNFILQEVCGQDDICFTFEGMAEVQDQAALTDMMIKQVQSGMKSIDEARDELHLIPWGLKETSEPLVFTQMGPVELGQAVADTATQIRQALTGAHDSAQAHQSVESLGRRAVSGAGSGRKALPAGTSGQGRMNGPVTQRQARRGGALAPANATAEGAPGHSGGKPAPKPAPKAAAAELEALARHLNKGMPLAEWVPEHLPGLVMATIGQDLEAGLSGAYACKSAAALLPKAAPQPQQSPQQQQMQQAAAANTARVQAAISAALAAAAKLVAAWASGALAITAAGLAALILDQLRRELIPALTAVWTAAWQAAEQAAGQDTPAGALEAWLATEGENWLQQIGDTGETGLLQAIRDALTAGDPDLIVTALSDLLDPPGRADMITSTEVTRAWNAAMALLLRLLGLWQQWNTRNDARVCASCRANQDQGPVPPGKAFQSGAYSPPQHPRCRCWVTAAKPPASPVTGKVLRREVGLNGQETWTEWEPPPDVPGGRTFYPHLADGTQVVPGGMTAAEFPRWDGTEPDPVTEHVPDPDFGDDAGIGPRPDVGARPGTYWPAPYMDGWWPSPHGHGTGQPPVSSPGSANGRPPNGAGKNRKGGDAALRFLRSAPHAKPGTVYHQMTGNFPPESLAWVKRIRWAGPVDIPLDLIDTAGRDKWAARHDHAHVADIARKLEQGEHVNPVIGVVRAGHNHIRMIDGRHRFTAAEQQGKTVRGYVGYLDDANEKAAYDTYLHQHHSGDDPQNKSFTAGNLGLAGNVSGLVPLTVEGQRQGAYCSGLLVRAADTGRVLLLQRAITGDDPAGGLWEVPGGHAEDGESLLDAARREWAEETGCEVPDGGLTGRWAASNGIWEGFVLSVPSETSVDIFGDRDAAWNPDDPHGDKTEAIAWWDPRLIAANPAVRPELAADLPMILRALGGLGKSAETPVLEVTPHLLGPEGLWHTPDRHVGGKQKLPDYIENVAAALMRDQGMGESEAIATAINAIKRWAAGDLHWGHGKVTPVVIAASRDALAQWDKLKESHHG